MYPIFSTPANNLPEFDFAKAERILKMFDELSAYYADDYQDKYIKKQYFFNKQFSQAETLEYGQSTKFDPVPINVVRPTIDQMTAILTSDRPIFKVVPINEKDKIGAYLMNDMLYGFAVNNDYDSIHRQDIRDLLCQGIAWNRLRVSDTEDEGIFNVVLEKVPFWQVLPSPRVKHANFDDMNRCIVFDYKPLDVVLKLVGKTKDEFKYDCRQLSSLYSLFRDSSLIDTDFFNTDGNPLTLVLDLYEQEIETKLKVESLDYNARVAYKLPLFLSEEELNTLRQSDPQFQQLIDSDQIHVKKVKRNTVYLQSYAGIYPKKRVDLKITDIPVMPLVYDFNENVLNIYGEIHYLQNLQDAINKCFKLTLANAVFSAVGRLLYQEDSVDPAKVEKWLSGEITALAYTQKNINQKDPPVQFFHGRQMETGFYQLYQDLFSKTEYMSGLYSILMGDASKAPDVFSTISAMEEFGTQRIKSVARAINNQRARQGKIALQFLQNFASVSDVVRFISETGEHQDVPVAIPEYNDAANIINMLVDLAAVEFDVACVSQPNFGTTRINKANALNTFFTQHNIPPSANTIGTMAKLMDMPELDSVAEDLSLQNKVNTLQQELDKINKMNADLENQVVKNKTALKVKDAEVVLEKILNKIEAESKINVSELKTYIKQVEKDLDNIVNEQEQKLQEESKEPAVE